MSNVYEWLERSYCVMINGRCWYVDGYVEPADISVGIMGVTFIIDSLRPQTGGLSDTDNRMIERILDGSDEEAYQEIERIIFEQMSESWFDTNYDYHMAESEPFPEFFEV